jgi:hypothetical protein
MKFNVDYLCIVNALPDDLTSSHNNPNPPYLDERKCRGDGRYLL